MTEVFSLGDASSSYIEIYILPQKIKNINVLTIKQNYKERATPGNYLKKITRTLSDKKKKKEKMEEKTRCSRWFCDVGRRESEFPAVPLWCKGKGEKEAARKILGDEASKASSWCPLKLSSYAALKGWFCSDPSLAACFFPAKTL